MTTFTEPERLELEYWARKFANPRRIFTAQELSGNAGLWHLHGLVLEEMERRGFKHCHNFIKSEDLWVWSFGWNLKTISAYGEGRYQDYRTACSLAARDAVGKENK